MLLLDWQSNAGKGILSQAEYRNTRIALVPLLDDETKSRRKARGRGAQAARNPTRGNHRASGTTGCGQAAKSVRCAGDVAGGLDYREDQEVTRMISWQNASGQPRPDSIPDNQ